VRPLAVRLGELNGGVPLRRSGLKWLVPDGHRCQADELVAHCTIGLGADSPFAEERGQVELLLTAGAAGILRHGEQRAAGGFLDRMPYFDWDADESWAHVENATAPAHEVPRCMFLVGRRFTEIANTRALLLNGWHDRTRAWWGESGHGGLLCAGVCEQEAIVRGFDDYRSLFALAAGPVHVVHGQDEPLVPTAVTLREQLERTPVERLAIREDIARTFGAEGPAPSAEEWMFAAALLNGLERSPLTDTYPLLTRAGYSDGGAADAICLSSTAELAETARHRSLGYTIALHGFTLRSLGPAARRWLRRSFEPMQRSIGSIAADYRALAAALPGRLLFVVNSVSSFAYESIADYASLDDATMARLASVRAKDLNLALHDLEEDHRLCIVDADAIAADLGMARHLPDGIHGSGAFYAAVRAELVRQLGNWGVPGFAIRR